MAQHNEVTQRTQRNRRRRVHKILNNSQAEMNGLRLPKILPRYLGMECSDDDVLWAYFAESLAGIAKAFEESDTDGIFRYRAKDLDNTDEDTEYIPVFSVVRWVPVPATR